MTQNTALDHFDEHEIVIPITVIEELDRFKKDNNETGRNARMVSRRLDQLRRQGKLAEGVPLYRSDLTAGERDELQPFFLLTDKPVLAVVNLDEDQVVGSDEVLAPVAAELAGAEVIGMCVQLEAEAALLGDGDRAEILDGLGLGEGALPRFVRAAHHLLGLRTFFTVQ